jgi:hypothetical protein
MDTNKIEILKTLITDLNKKEFDLDAWKLKSEVVLKKILGPDDEKIQYLKNLRYDYSSWALRDHSGGTQHDSVKESAKNIIETALLELSLSETDNNWSAFLQNELSKSDFSKLQDIRINTKNTQSDIDQFIEDMSNKSKNRILAALITNALQKK